MHTTACELLNIKHPVIQAPMGGAVGPELAAAVSNAGGLGMLPLWMTDLDTTRSQIRAMKERSGNPFAVNLNMEFPQEERLDVCLEEGVPIISFFWQDSSSLVSKAKAAGALVMHTVANVEQAKIALDSGVDVLVAQGWEAGGHVRGNVASMPLIPSIVDVAGDKPVIAAGGISDGRGLAAALCLGASGVWLGTRFLAAEEVDVHPEYRRAILDASEDGTTHVENLFNVGWANAPHRVITNSTVKAWIEAGQPTTDRPGEGDVLGGGSMSGDVVRYMSYTPNHNATGDVEAISLWAGQSAGLVNTVKPAADIVTEIVSDAENILNKLSF